MRAKDTARVCVEATGIYHLDLCLALEKMEGIEVMVANPPCPQPAGARDYAPTTTPRPKLGCP